MRFLLLLLAFVLVPLAELAVIGEVADVIAWGPTLVLLVVDSVIGAWLVRREGSRAWQAFREAVAAGRMPGDELTEGALLLFGGALLLTPGFLTDVLGLALVLPVTRRPIARLVKRRAVAGAFGAVRIDPMSWTGGSRRSSGGDGGARGRGDGGAGGEGVEVLSVERDEPPRVGDGDAGTRD